MDWAVWAPLRRNLRTSVPKPWEEMAKWNVSFSVHACFVWSLSVRKAETQLGPGGNAFPLRGCRSGSERPHRIYISIPQRRVDRGKEKEDACKKRVKWRERVIELINLTSHSLTASPLESTGDKGAHGERLATSRTKTRRTAVVASPKLAFFPTSGWDISHISARTLW